MLVDRGSSTVDGRLYSSVLFDLHSVLRGAQSRRGWNLYAPGDAVIIGLCGRKAHTQQHRKIGDRCEQYVARGSCRPLVQDLQAETHKSNSENSCADEVNHIRHAQIARYEADGNEE